MAEQISEARTFNEDERALIRTLRRRNKLSSFWESEEFKVLYVWDRKTRSTSCIINDLGTNFYYIGTVIRGPRDKNSVKVAQTTALRAAIIGDPYKTVQDPLEIARAQRKDKVDRMKKFFADKKKNHEKNDFKKLMIETEIKGLQSVIDELWAEWRRLRWGRL